MIIPIDTNMNTIDDAEYSITPIAKDFKKEGPCSRKDWNEQLERASEFKQMMWDDTPKNNSKKGDILMVWHHMKGVTFHSIQDVLPPSKRLPSWSNNVGQGDRQVLYISSEFARLEWNEWIKAGGQSRCMGTSSVKTAVPTIIDALKKKYRYN